MTILGRLSSLRGRITLIVAVVFAVSLAAGSWFLLREVEHSLIADIEAADLAELEMLAAALEGSPVLDLSTPRGLIVSGGRVLPAGEDGTSFQIISGGELLASTPVIGSSFGFLGEVPFDGAIPIPPELIGLTGEMVVGERAEVTTVTLSVPIDGQDVVFAATSSLEPVRSSVGTLRSLLWFAVPLLVGAVALLAWFITGRALRPVAAIAGQAKRITGSNLHERVPVPNTSDEIRHLAETVNAMLERIEDSRRHQLRFVSDASHELRSPVATSSARLQVALAHPDDVDWQATGQTVLVEQDRLARLVDDLLLLARLGEVPDQVRRDVDLDHIALEEASRIDGFEIDTSTVGAGRVSGDPAQLGRAISNLLDNAARHAVDGIRIGVEKSSGTVVLTVDDDGPGIPPAERDAVFARFARVGDARSREDGGSGIGLAIVAAVVEAHDGTAAVTTSDLGGARFTLTLPAG